MKVFLLGFSGCGKTSVGKRLSNLLGYDFFDLDSFFEKQENCSIADFFSKKGQDVFREKEAALLRTTASFTNVVVALGGGTPCFYNNMEWINKNGCSVYISMPVKALYSRLKGRTAHRPLLQVADLEQYIKTTLSERELFYRQANIVVEGLDIDINKLSLLIKQRVEQ